MDQHWDELVKHFCSVSDGLGMPIDDEIFDTVVALNALGITTTMSCASHITRNDGDIRNPWVDFSTSDSPIAGMKKEQAKLHKKALKRHRISQKHQLLSTRGKDHGLNEEHKNPEKVWGDPLPRPAPFVVEACCLTSSFLRKASVIPCTILLLLSVMVSLDRR